MMADPLYRFGWMAGTTPLHCYRLNYPTWRDRVTFAKIGTSAALCGYRRHSDFVGCLRAVVRLVFRCRKCQAIYEKRTRRFKEVRA